MLNRLHINDIIRPNQNKSFSDVFKGAVLFINLICFIRKHQVLIIYNFFSKFQLEIKLRNGLTTSITNKYIFINSWGKSKGLPQAFLSL